MEIKVSTEDGRVPVTVVHVDGDIDSSTYEAFESKVMELISDGSKDILIDLTHVHFVSSAGIRAFNAVFNKLREVEPDVSDEEMRKGISAGTYKFSHLKLLHPSKETRGTLQMVGLDMYVDIYDDLDTALAAF